MIEIKAFTWAVYSHSAIFAVLAAQKPGLGGEIQLTDANGTLAGTEPVDAYEVDGAWLDDGDPASFIRAHLQQLEKRAEVLVQIREDLARLLGRKGSN